MELLVLEFDKKRSKNKELLELGLEIGSLFKKCTVLITVIFLYFESGLFFCWQMVLLFTLQSNQIWTTFVE